jgi:hypothetical protein
MSIRDNWLSNFRSVVSHEITAAHDRPSQAYQTVSDKTGFGKDYVYQLYKGKSTGGQRYPSMKMMSAIAKEYADGRDLDWINREPGTKSSNQVFSPQALDLATMFDRIKDAQKRMVLLSRCVLVLTENSLIEKAFDPEPTQAQNHSPGKQPASGPKQQRG